MSNDENQAARFQAMTKMLIEASTLLLNETESMLGMYGEPTFAQQNLRQLIEHVEHSLTYRANDAMHK